MTTSLSDQAETKPRSAPNATSISTEEKRVLARVFQHPLSHNLSWRETFELLRAVGTVDQAHNGDVISKVGGEHQTVVSAYLMKHSVSSSQPEKTAAMLRHAYSKGVLRQAHRDRRTLSEAMRLNYRRTIGVIVIA